MKHGVVTFVTFGSSDNLPFLCGEELSQPLRDTEMEGTEGINHVTTVCTQCSRKTSEQLQLGATGVCPSAGTGWLDSTSFLSFPMPDINFPPDRRWSHRDKSLGLETSCRWGFPISSLLHIFSSFVSHPPSTSPVYLSSFFSCPHLHFLPFSHVGNIMGTKTFRFDNFLLFNSKYSVDTKIL